MLQAYVGVASKQGLYLLCPEHDGTRLSVRRTVRSCTGRIGFWAVLADSDAYTVQMLFQSGYRHEALVMLNRCARDIGRILPSDPVRSDPH